MSDNIRRFMAVRTSLLKSYPGQPSGRLARHLCTLAGMTSGIVAAGTTHLAKIAQKAPDRTKTESRAKRFTRFLKNERTTFETFYLPFARTVAASLSEAGSPLLVVFDGSPVGRGCACMMASIVYQGRALPLAWAVKRGKKGHFSSKDHLGLLGRVREVVSEQAQVIFLGDGEFDSVALQRALEEAGWHYVCRTSSSTRLSDGFTECRIGELAPRAGERYVSVPGASVTQAGYGPVHVICWHEPSHESPVLLVTNMALAEEAMHFYSYRFRIETLFSDQKSRGFHVHKSHISDPERLSRLLIATALGYLWMVYLGVVAIEKEYYKQFHRTGRIDLSLFQLGRRLLEYLLNQSMRILVAFTVPPESVR